MVFEDSVNGIRAFAKRGGAEVEYIELPDDSQGLRSNVDNLKVNHRFGFNFNHPGS